MMFVWLKFGMRCSCSDVSVVLRRFLVLPSSIRLRSIFLWLFLHIMKSRGFPVLCKKPLSKLNWYLCEFHPPPPYVSWFVPFRSLSRNIFQRLLWHIKRKNNSNFLIKACLNVLAFLLLLVGKFNEGLSKLQKNWKPFYVCYIYIQKIAGAKLYIGASKLDRLWTISE